MYVNLFICMHADMTVLLFLISENILIKHEKFLPIFSYNNSYAPR